MNRARRVSADGPFSAFYSSTCFVQLKELEMSLLRKIIIAILLVSLVAISSMTLAQDSTPSVTVKIAILGPFTGPAASIGQEQLNWAKLAVEDFNTNTGWNVEAVEGDTELDPAKATTVAQSIV